MKRNNFRKIGFIGSPDCITKSQKVKKLLFKIKNECNFPIEIVGGGNTTGFENDVKRAALDLKMIYAEHNPFCTEHNIFSVENETKYGKPYHFTYIISRYDRLLNYCDSIVFGNDDGVAVGEIYQQLLMKAAKKNKKIIFL
jgi:hypothetical protein